MAVANNSIAPRTGSTVLDPTNMKPTQLFTSAAIRKILTSTLQSEQKASVVVATLISILNISPRFQNCNSMELLGNVLRFEIGMGLSWAMGDYAVIDHGGRPTFQMQYQGTTKMAFASGAYEDGDILDVREGEYKGLESKTRKPIIEWIENDEEREKLPIVGYYAWVKLIDRPPHYGRFKSKYMSHDAILRYADTYSKPFQNCGGYKAYKAAMDGKGNFIKNGNTPWFAPPDSTGHMKMCKKTVLIQLLKDPMLPKSNGIFDSYMEADELTERTGEAPTFDDEYTRMAKEAALSAAREAPTAQIEAPATTIPTQVENPVQTVVVDERPIQDTAPIQQAAPEPAPARRGRPKRNADGGPRETVSSAAPQNDSGSQALMMEYPYPGQASVPEADPDDPLGGW